jgi:hypothetical protein
MELDELAFDHKDILTAAWRWLVETFIDGTALPTFLPPTFTRADLTRFFRELRVEPRRRKAAIERFLTERAEPIPGQVGRYRTKPRRSPPRAKGPPRRGSQSPSRGA